MKAIIQTTEYRRKRAEIDEFYSRFCGDSSIIPIEVSNAWDRSIENLNTEFTADI